MHQNNVMEKIYLKQITLDDIYVSVLDARVVTDKDGKFYWEPIDKRIKPTGSMVMDIIARIWAQDIRTRPSEIADAMGKDMRALCVTFTFLTGKLIRDFINEYRLRMICEWLSCTDLSMQEIVRRTGICKQSAFSRFFTERMKYTPKEYRRKYRPDDFRGRYKWK